MKTADEAAAQWARIGGGFSGSPADTPMPLESLIARSTGFIQEEPRILSVATTWMSVHHGLINESSMAAELERLQGKDRAVAGAMIDIAQQNGGGEKLGSLLCHCRPLATPEPLFNRWMESERLRQWAQQEALPIYLNWGLWYHEITLKNDAIRPIKWIVKNCPELKERALLDPEMETGTKGACSIAEAGP